MAPELVEKKGYDGVATDCWALGVLLYKILINRTPFEGKFLADNGEKISMRPIWRQIS
jgi:serine/threonine protein kinase